MIIYIAAAAVSFIVITVLLVKDVKELREQLNEKGMECNEQRQRALEAESKINEAIRYANEYLQDIDYLERLEEVGFLEGLTFVIEELDSQWDAGPITTEDILNERFSNKEQG